MGGWWEDHLPAMAMSSLQLSYAIMALMNRAALLKGMSPMVFIVYRQGIATLAIAPIAYLSRKKGHASSSSIIGLKSFCLIFVTAFIGVVLNQTMYFQGIYLASSSIGSAMANLVPAVTFMIAALFGLEQVNLKALPSIAKILGTTVCVGGAISMALLRGPKLFNPLELVLHGGDSTWLLGCLCLLASCFCWSSWLVLQVPLTKYYPDHLSLSAWMCFLSMLQAAAVALFMEKDPQAWILSSTLELSCCFVSGVFGSGVQFFVQSWCIQRKGPFYSALFFPLATVLTTILACIILHEEIYVGSLLGAIAVISGLYVVLWGKSNEMKRISEPLGEDCANEPTLEKTTDHNDLEQPLLPESFDYDDAKKDYTSSK